MTALRADGIAHLLNAARRVEAFWVNGKVPTNVRKREDEEKEIKAQLVKALELVCEAEAFHEVAALLMSVKGLEDGFIQQTIALDKEPVGKVPGGAGALVYGHFFRERYRVFLHTGKAFTEESGPDLLTAIRAAFEKLNLELPPQFPTKSPQS